MKKSIKSRLEILLKTDVRVFNRYIKFSTSIRFLFKVDLRSADLSYANLSSANLRSADLSSANLSYADLRSADLRSANLSYADLSYADLRSADLSYANLSYANLRSADLSSANLSSADLSYANLSYANLSSANLRSADLRSANLSSANLSYADLRSANLRSADLSSANLRSADLRSANLRSANLRSADLRSANFSENTGFLLSQCPSEGSFIGWKAASNLVVKLQITDDSKRSSATTLKCRCSKVLVLAIENKDGSASLKTEVCSDYISSFIYKVGEIIEEPDFDEDRFNECSKGIHFFISREMAVKYN